MELKGYFLFTDKHDICALVLPAEGDNTSLLILPHGENLCIYHRKETTYSLND